MNQAQINIAALLLQSYGYLSAADLLLYLDAQLIVTRQDVVPDACQRAVRAAIADITSTLRNQYDLSQEFSKTDTVPPAATCAVAAGAISAGSITGPGTNFFGVPIIQLTNATGDPGTGGVLTAIVTSSTISSLQILDKGIRYHQPPIISFVPVDGNGSGGVATCTIDSCGRLMAVTLISGGTGWTAIPTVVFTPVDGFGIGAIAIANVQFGQLTDIEITDPGSGYVKPPTLRFSGGQVAQSRNDKLVTICAPIAVYKLMSGAQSLSKVHEENNRVAHAELEQIRIGQDNLPIYGAARQIRSNVSLSQDRFRQIG